MYPLGGGSTNLTLNQCPAVTAFNPRAFWGVTGCLTEDINLFRGNKCLYVCCFWLFTSAVISRIYKSVYASSYNVQHGHFRKICQKKAHLRKLPVISVIMASFIVTSVCTHSHLYTSMESSRLLDSLVYHLQVGGCLFGLWGKCTNHKVFFVKHQVHCYHLDIYIFYKVLILNCMEYWHAV